MGGGIRLLLLVYNLALLFIAGLLIASAVGEVNPKPYVDLAMSTSQNRFILGIAGVIICLLSMIGMVKAIFGGSKKPVTVPIEGSSIGNIDITVPAIIVMVMIAVKTIKDVREVKPKVRKSSNGLVIELHMMINPEHIVPEMSINVQNAVKNHLEELGGLRVASVKVLVDDFLSPDKQTRS